MIGLQISRWTWLVKCLSDLRQIPSSPISLLSFECGCPAARSDFPWRSRRMPAWIWDEYTAPANRSHEDLCLGSPLPLFHTCAFGPLLQSFAALWQPPLRYRAPGEGRRRCTFENSFGGSYLRNIPSITLIMLLKSNGEPSGTRSPPPSHLAHLAKYHFCNKDDQSQKQQQGSSWHSLLHRPLRQSAGLCNQTLLGLIFCEDLSPIGQDQLGKIRVDPQVSIL